MLQDSRKNYCCWYSDDIPDVTVVRAESLEAELAVSVASAAGTVVASPVGLAVDETLNPSVGAPSVTILVVFASVVVVSRTK